MKKLKAENCIGVWLDHEKAIFINPNEKEHKFEKIYSNVESQLRIAGEDASGTRFRNNRSTNDEYSKHHNEQEHLKSYYKTLMAKIKPFEGVFLFGPSTAKNELRNLINQDKSFDKFVIETENSDDLTDNQLVAKVTKHFQQLT